MCHDVFPFVVEGQDLEALWGCVRTILFKRGHRFAIPHLCCDASRVFTLYILQILQMMKEVTTFEHTQHPIVLVPPKDPHPSFPFCSENPQTCSEEYIRLCSIKAHLVIRLLEERIQPQVLAQVLNKSLALAATAAGSKEQESWSSMLLSTEEFVKGINTVTAKDIQPFMDTWVYAGGHARFKGRFSFNRKKNTVEMELSQETGGLCLRLRALFFGYSGPKLPRYNVPVRVLSLKPETDKVYINTCERLYLHLSILQRRMRQSLVLCFVIFPTSFMGSPPSKSGFHRVWLFTGQIRVLSV